MTLIEIILAKISMAIEFETNLDTQASDPGDNLTWLQETLNDLNTMIPSLGSQGIIDQFNVANGIFNSSLFPEFGEGTPSTDPLIIALNSLSGAVTTYQSIISQVIPLLNDCWTQLNVLAGYKTGDPTAASIAAMQSLIKDYANLNTVFSNNLILLNLTTLSATQYQTYFSDLVGSNDGEIGIGWCLYQAENSSNSWYWIEKSANTSSAIVMNVGISQANLLNPLLQLFNNVTNSSSRDKAA